MPAGPTQRNQQRDSPPQAQASASSSTTKTTHIRNKDGTKLIAVPARQPSTSESAPTPPPPPAASPMDNNANGAHAQSASAKKKKKKKGAKQNAAQSAQPQSQHPSADGADDLVYDQDYAPPPLPHDAHEYQQDIRSSMAEFEDGEVPPEGLGDEGDYESDQDHYEDDEAYSQASHNAPPAQAQPATGGKKNKKKKKKKGGNGGGGNEQSGGGGGGGQVQSSKKGKDRIWNTSTAEERERIKDFWLSLGEEERRSLVKVEKEAVLRKMKEQQKHSCSCSVCGRKRTAIEEELEVLYDAYYEELEQYANLQQTNKYLGHIPPPHAYAANAIPPPPPPPNGPPPIHRGHHNHHVEELDDEEYEDDDEEYDDDDEDDEDDGVEGPLVQNDPRPDFFNFGNSLTVQGGILTVADDLLKNDGKKFIEMMEQLAERRMAREEEANAAANGHQPMPLSLQQAHAAHSHSQPEYDDEEDYDEEDEDEEYDDEEEEEDEPDTMTEEQRMEEGRRMFQIFAARMFEQRVLTAYREKVARERQRKLLEELEEENRRQLEREEKKAKDKDRKKERKRLQRQAKEEERLRKEAEKAAEEAKQREIEAKKAEENRKRKEEQRLKREAERKAAEEERQRKEEEKRKRIQEEKEREAERERKRKEHQERERKKKEEAARREKEERIAREKEARERKEREEKERKEREARAKKEAAEKERKRKEDEAKAKAEAAIAAAAKRTQMAVPPAHLQGQQSKTASPSLTVVTPAMHKATLNPPGLNGAIPSRQGSFQNSQGSSPKTPSAPPGIGFNPTPSTPIMSQSLPGPMHAPNKVFGFPNPGGVAPSSPMPHHIAPPPGVQVPDTVFGNLSPMGMNAPMHQQPFSPAPPGRQHRQSLGNIPMFPQNQSGFAPGSPYRGFGTPNGMPMNIPNPPGMRPLGPSGRGFMDMSHPAPPPGVGFPAAGSPFMGRAEPSPIGTHARMPSGGFEPIHRPTPIQRPSSVSTGRKNSGDNGDVEEIAKVMGSRALLDDDDVDILPENISPSRRSSHNHFAPRPTRGAPPSSLLFGDSFSGGGFKDYGASWSNNNNTLSSLGALSGSLPSGWGANGAGWSEVDAQRSTFNRRRGNRWDQVRILACQKCREAGLGQIHELSSLHREILAEAPDLEVQASDFVDILDMEGDSQNGGGTFIIGHNNNGQTVVRYEPEEPSDPIPFGSFGSRLGDIGSPRMNGGLPFRQNPMGPPGMASSPAGF